MALSIYDISVPVLKRALGILALYMDEAAKYAEEAGIKPEVLVNARLAPDMLPLSAQIQRASDSAKSIMSRLTGVEVPSFPDTETTFAELKQRLEKTIAYLDTIKPADLAGAESKMVELKFKKWSATLRGDAFVTTYLLPNFYFHVVTAHDILRHNGMKVGKRDYLGAYT